MTQREAPDRFKTDLLFSGMREAAAAAESAAAELIRTFGEDCPLESPDTAYPCPLLRALTGTELSRARDLPACLQALRSLQGHPAQELAALSYGQTALLYAEINALLRDVLRRGKETGCVPDSVIRMLGVPLITGDMPGIAVIMGRAECAAHVAVLVRNYREKGLGVFLSGDAAVQAQAEGISPAADRFICISGREWPDDIHAISALVRIAMIFCGVASNDGKALQRSLRERIPAFVNAFGISGGQIAAALAGVAELGLPVIFAAKPADLGVAETLFTAARPEEMVEVSLKKRGIKVRPKAIDLPSGYDAAFEGEHVRDSDCAVVFPCACELVRMLPSDAVEDHRITLIGADFPAERTGCTEMDLAISAEVSGTRMRPEFGPVIERRVHTWLSYASGVQHSGSRSKVSLRISRASLESGLHLTDLAEVLYTGIRTEFEPIVDKCQITLMTDPAAVKEFVSDIAGPQYLERDARLSTLTDESVDRFYSCTMCQSIAPHHCCIVTPERGGMCGAITWLDAAAAYELSDSGPNRPILKGAPRSALLGAFDAVDRAAAAATAGAVKQLSLYSIMTDPMTSCGRLECICAVEPRSGGVAIVDRDYPGMTPLGMTFEELGAVVFGGEQIPGMMGVSRRYISSHKFLRAEGGALRIVWMPKALKAEISDRLDETVRVLYGIENFCSMICDESIASDPDALYAFLVDQRHPVLGMDPLL